MNTTKITAKIYEPMLKSFNAQLGVLLVKRDAFLDRVIAQEIPRLRKDLEGRKQSIAARRYIAGQLKRMGPGNKLSTVNIVVSLSTANALREAVEAHNLQRDAFINRLIALLRCAPLVRNALKLPTTVGSPALSGLESMSVGPLDAMAELFADPLFYLRGHVETHFNEGLYTVNGLPIGLSCYLDDSSVPATESHKSLIGLLIEDDFCDADFPSLTEQGERS